MADDDKITEQDGLAADFDDDEGDDIADAIRAAMGEDTDEDDDGGLDADFSDAGGEDTISASEADEMAEQAALDRKAPAEKDKPEEGKAEGGADAKAESEKDEAGEGETATEEEGEREAPDLTAMDLPSLVEGLPDDRKAEIARRMQESSRILAPFQTPEVKADLERTGATPEQAVERFVQLHRFASANPGEYMAWVARQTGDKAEEVFTKAAEVLGYKIARADEGEDDVFEDDTTKQLRQQVRDLEARLNGQQPIGPDSPEFQSQWQAQRAAQEIQSWSTATDPVTGQPLRPHWDYVAPVVAQRAAQVREQTGQPISFEQLQALYNDAVQEMGQRFGGNAAQPAQPAQQPPQQDAAAAEKARRASKSVDGSGQSASRRPALDPDADLESVIRHFGQQHGVL